MKQYTILLFFWCAACAGPTQEAKGVLTKEELTTFLIEMYLAESKLDNIPIEKDSALKLFMPYEEKLMKKYNLADSTLRKTYQYYMDHPKEMEAVYDAVIDSLSLREQRTPN